MTRASWWKVASALGGAFLAPAAADARVGPTLRELVEVADVEALAASPDGRRVAFRVQRPSIRANSYRIDWYVGDLVRGAVTRVADGGAPIYTNGIIENEAPVWSPDSRAFYRRALVGGAIGVWRTAADGSENHRVVGGPANVESLAAAADGRILSYVTGPTRAQLAAAERREYDEGILVDASIDTLQNPFRGGWEKGRLASQRLIGRWYQRGDLLWQAPRTEHRLGLLTLRELPTRNVAAAGLEPLTPSQAPPSLRARSASGAVVSLSEVNGSQRLTAVSAKHAAALCDSGPCALKIASLAWRPASNEVIFTAQDQHFLQSLYAWDIRSGKVRRIAGGNGQLSGGRPGSAPCALTSAAAICVEAGPVSPPRLVRIDLERGSVQPLFDPNASLRRHSPAAVEQLIFTLGDGRVSTGTLLYPPGPRPARAPLFVQYYFCPGYLRGGTGGPFPFEPLVDAGFVVACLNIVPFNQWGDGADRDRAALASVSALIALLERRGWIDRSRVGMGGFSAGSEATMWVAMNSNLLGAAAVASPQYEPTAYWLSAVRGRDVPQVMRKFQQAGAPDQDPARWKIISPALNTDRIKAPLLMQLPEQEMRGSMELYSKLSNTTTPVEMYVFPDEAHIKLQPRHQFAVFRRNLDWFRFWLQDMVDPDPSRVAQYGRWKELRGRRHGSAE